MQLKGTTTPLWAEVGTSQKPHATVGPLGQWVANGYWAMRVDSVEVVPDIGSYRKLPWTAKKNDKHFAEVDRLVFSRGGTVALVKVELRNQGAGPRKIGAVVPMWVLRCDDGQQIRNSGVQHQELPAMLEGGLPAEASVAQGETVAGTLGFFLPKNRTPRLLFWNAPGVLEKDYGPTESLVSRLEASSAHDPAPLVGDPDVPWASNSLWKMRLNGYRLVEDLAAYRALPWTSRMSAEEAEKHFSYVGRNVFDKGGKVALVRVEFKNLSDDKRDIGYTIPFWVLRCRDGKELRNAGVYQQAVPWGLAGGMPKRTKLNPRATAGGFMGFFLPAGSEPEALFFQVSGSLEKTYGKSGSLTFPVK